MQLRLVDLAGKSLDNNDDSVCMASMRVHTKKSRSVSTVLGSLLSFFFFSSRRRHTRCSRDWSSDVCSSDLFAVAVVGSSTVLAIQYFRRKTIRARWLMAVAGFVFLLGHTVPWHFAFAVEQRLSPNPGAGRAITAIFDPSGSKFRLPEGLNHNSWFRAGGLTRDEGSTIYLPIRVAGLAESTVPYRRSARYFR